MSYKEAEKLAISAFDDTIPRWQEAGDRSTTSLVSLQAGSFGQTFGMGNTTKHTFSPCVPLVADFVADVQLCANRTLSAEELEYFNNRYRDLGQPLDRVEVAERKLDKTVRIRLGSALIHAGIYPFPAYTAPFDPRGNRYPERMRRLAIRIKSSR